MRIRYKGCLTIIAVLAALLTLQTLPAAAAVKDVSASGINDPYINYLMSRKIMSGYSDGSFRTGAYVTRAETAVILCKACGIKPEMPGKAFYADVNKKNWAFGYIEASAKAGLMSGSAEHQFRPNDRMTRAELAALLMKTSGEPLPEMAAPVGITDVASAHWAKNAIYAVVDAEMIPTVNHRFYPDWFVNRGEIATALGVLISRAPRLRAAELTGQLIPLTGSVYVTLPGQREMKISEKTALPPGGRIRTGSDGEAALVFSDKSSFLCKTNTEVVVKSAQGQMYVKQDGSGGTAVDQINVGVSRGRVFFVLATTYLFGNQEAKTTEVTGQKQAAAGSKALNPMTGSSGLFAAVPADEKNINWWKQATAKRVRVQVDMPWGVAGIRGCVGSASVTEAGQGISLLSGEATLTSENGAPVTIAPDQMTMIAAPGAVASPPAPLPPSEQAAFRQEANWAMNILAQAASEVPALLPMPIEVSPDQETAMQTQKSTGPIAAARPQGQATAPPATVI